MPFGCVRFFDAPKGYGFIIPDVDGKDVFVDKAAMRHAGMIELEKGQRVTYETEQDVRGAVKAVKLERVEPAKKKPVRPSNFPERHVRSSFANGASPRKLITGSHEWQRNYERYVELARNTIEDRVTREGYLQHAEHYYRMMNGSAS
jgi:CspA family cold shock protein